MKNSESSSLIGKLALVAVALIVGANGAPSSAVDPPVKSVQKQNSAPRQSGLCVLSGDGDYHAWATADGRIRCCRNEDGAVLMFYHCSPSALAFSSDGQILASAGSRKPLGATIKVWSLAGARLLALLTNLTAEPQVLAVSACGLFVVENSGTMRINCWQASAGKMTWTISTHTHVAELRFSADASFVIAKFVDNQVQVFRTADGTRKL